ARRQVRLRPRLRRLREPGGRGRQPEGAVGGTGRLDDRRGGERRGAPHRRRCPGRARRPDRPGARLCAADPGRRGHPARLLPVGPMIGRNILTALILLPLAGALVVATIPRKLERVQKLVALGFTTAAFALSMVMLRGFLPQAKMQFEVSRAWIPAYGISYHVGVDGLSVWLVILTTFLTPVALLASWSSIHERV